MSHKRNKPTQPSTKHQRIAELETELAREHALNQRLQKQLERLQVEVEELKRAGKRQAAPFARRKWVAHPQRPGRKAGRGNFAHRPQPSLKQVNETKTAKLHGCPDCGGERLVWQSE